MCAGGPIVLLVLFFFLNNLADRGQNREILFMKIARFVLVIHRYLFFDVVECAKCKIASGTTIVSLAKCSKFSHRQRSMGAIATILWCKMFWFFFVWKDRKKIWRTIKRGILSCIWRIKIADNKAIMRATETLITMKRWNIWMRAEKIVCIKWQIECERKLIESMVASFGWVRASALCGQRFRLVNRSIGRSIDTNRDSQYNLLHFAGFRAL